MQYGIINGNDPYLYGEKVKAYLRRGAAPLPGIREYPDERVGMEHYVQHKVSLKYEKCEVFTTTISGKLI